MLPTSNRLKKTKDFGRIYEQGVFVSEKFITFKYAKNGLKLSRFGIVVSNKISKKAVERNKIKRRLRASVRECLGKVKPGFDIVVMVKKEILEADFETIKNIINRLITSIGT